MNKKEHATLLAKKIFTSNNSDEVQSFVALDLDVNWLAPLDQHTVLIERAA